MICENTRFYLTKNKAQANPFVDKVLPKMREKLDDLIRRKMKDVGIASKAELARKLGISAPYAGDLVNGTGKTQSGNYQPSKELIQKLAEVLQIATSEILDSLGWHQIEKPVNKRVTTVVEFFQALETLGIDVQFDGGIKMLETLDADDLQDLLDTVKTSALVKVHRKNKKAQV